MKTFIAYDTAISTKLDLRPYLLEGSEGRYALEVVLGGDNLVEDQFKFRLHLTASHGRDLSLATDRELSASMPGQPWCFEVEGVVRFTWKGGSRLVAIESLKECTDKLIAFWLIHIFLPLYFTLEGWYEVIHACAVEVDGHAVLFTGPSHGGKSTLTDFFLQQGHSLISDDKVATFADDGRYFAVPSHPNHRPYRRAEDLGHRVERFSRQVQHIDRIYALKAAEPDAPVRIEAVKGHRKFADLLPSHLFDLGIERERRIRYLTALLGWVPVYRVTLPWELKRLKAVHDAIRANLER